MEKGAPIFYFNRHSGKTERERVMGEAWLRRVYETPVLGSLALEAAAKRAWFSKLYGWMMDRPSSRKKIAPFIQKYGIDTGEFLNPPESFESFNAFFSRALKPSARPIEQGDDTFVFGADGRHMAIAQLGRETEFFVKGQKMNLERLLGDADLARRYEEGVLVLSRLCPLDYHRFHFGAGGRASAARRIKGFLYSVNPIALRRRLSILWENERVRTSLQTERFGEVQILEIGATNVGRICQCYTPESEVQKGALKGYFEFGGSSVITLFEKGRVELAEDLARYSEKGVELYAHMGTPMARARA